MPYVPSRKTNPSAEDREVIDVAVERVAWAAAGMIKENGDLAVVYENIFRETATHLDEFLAGESTSVNTRSCRDLAGTIYAISKKYGYDGAHLGEFNYAFTRFIQRVPQIKVGRGDWKENDELRYWVYARTVKALISVVNGDLLTLTSSDLVGVFEDIKDEYKRRVNFAYEAAQIIKNGDCYNTPYYTRLVEVTDQRGNHIGHMEVMLKRSDRTVDLDLLPLKIVLK